MSSRNEIIKQKSDNECKEIDEGIYLLRTIRF